MKGSLSERLSAKIQRGAPDECWPFIGCKTDEGYGKVASGLRLGHTVLAHRASYEEAYGQIPDGLWVLHRCDNPPCCNPRHLFLGNALTNVQDMDRKGRRRSLSRRGETNPCAKLTEAQAAASIERRYKGETYRSIAQDYGVSIGAIYQITSGRKWIHLRPKTGEKYGNSRSD